MKPYRGARRRGIRGMVGLFRGVVLDGGESEVIRARSPRLAAVLAQLLNGDEVPRSHVEDRSPVPGYSVAHAGKSPERYLVVAIQSTARKPRAFGDGVIAMSSDAPLAESVARKLNEIDPRARPRATRGPGWW